MRKHGNFHFKAFVYDALGVYDVLVPNVELFVSLDFVLADEDFYFSCDYHLSVFTCYIHIGYNTNGGRDSRKQLYLHVIYISDTTECLQYAVIQYGSSSRVAKNPHAKAVQPTRIFEIYQYFFDKSFKLNITPHSLFVNTSFKNRYSSFPVGNETGEYGVGDAGVFASEVFYFALVTEYLCGDVRFVHSDW